MITFETTIFIDRPPQEVFDFVYNLANAPKWQVNVVSVEWTSEGPIGVGSTQRTVSRFLGRELESTVEITVWDPPNQTALKSIEGPLQFEATTRYESKGSGTQYTVSLTGETGGFFKLAEGLVGKQFEKQFETSLGALKLLLEEG